LGIFSKAGQPLLCRRFKERIGVKRSIGGIKVFRIVHDIFRNFREGFANLVMETACGLRNWRLDFRLTT